MTTSTEVYLPQTTSSGDEALKIVDAYREDYDEHFRVEALEAEFPRFSDILGSQAVFLARAGDNLAGTFKWRGALNGAVHLAREGASSLVVPSAGNHARGAVLAAKHLDMDVHVVVPGTAPPAKKEGLRELWDDPRLHIHATGASFDDAKEWALKHPELGALLHPYDNPHVADGQGTLGQDIIDAHADVRHIVLPVGGGGLLAGVAKRLADQGRDSIMIHAIEASGSNSLSRSLQKNLLSTAESPNPRYGGSAVRHVGGYALDICRDMPNLRLHTASEDDIDMLIDLYEQDRSDFWRETTPSYEPTSLVAIAGLMTVVKEYPNEKTIVIGTGHNDQLRPAPQAPRYRVPV